MTIELRGVDFFNKGAELMAHAIVYQINTDLPTAKLVMMPGNDKDFLKRTQLGLYQKFWFDRFGIPWWCFGWMIPQSSRFRYGIVTDREIDVVLDASGFAHSEQWGVQLTVSLAQSVKRWKNQGTKVILLPQALGPFHSPAMKKAFTYIAMNADLVFPRDDVSYRAVVDLVGGQPHIIQAPDFTNLLPGATPPDFDAERYRIALVPNCRMLDKTSTAVSQKYPEFMAECARYLLERDAGPYLLIHEGINDVRLAERIAEIAGGEIDIVQEEDPIRLKGIIGTARGMIGSRYHGLISALSQGVPALATGWSHKYETLMSEYGVDDGLVPVDIGRDDLHTRIDTLLSHAESEQYRAKLADAARIQRERAKRMWNEVFDCIGQPRDK